MLSKNQILHRQYLCSAGWQNKRIEALNHYGSKCNRCGEDGIDVHHKTYKRANGSELMSDLEMLCRGWVMKHTTPPKEPKRLRIVKNENVKTKTGIRREKLFIFRQL